MHDTKARASQFYRAFYKRQNYALSIKKICFKKYIVRCDSRQPASDVILSPKYSSPKNIKNWIHTRKTVQSYLRYPEIEMADPKYENLPGIVRNYEQIFRVNYWLFARSCDLNNVIFVGLRPARCVWNGWFTRSGPAGPQWGRGERMHRAAPPLCEGFFQQVQREILDWCCWFLGQIEP